ncbi:plexin domain-containing protein 1-like isoform X1 [Leptotrombidium deliense]|uniref:Plexin domain-containing protein 1-like isoform X1 n=1 Tax=Leptotrombidium deliense TaxID=299467 RepID=A0A443RWV6_9ACAR|nr:plexin domain-containing protein 1-like isoform X1 [Leptotrombidium deliense]
MDFTAVILTPGKFCITFNDCGTCMTTEKQLSCKWCESVKRCSDGNDRHRQQWLENKCETQENVSCSRSDELYNTTLTT